MLINKGNLLTEGAPPTPPPEFEFNNALDFGNSSTVEHVLFDDISNTGNSDFTISLWVKVTSIGGYWITGKDGASSQFQFYGNTSTNIRVRTASPAAFRNFAFPEMIIGTWYYVTLSAIGGQLRCYLNAIESTTGALTSGTSTLQFLGNDSGSLRGLQDDVGIKIGYGAIQTDVDALYNNGLGANFIDVIGSADLYYHLDESIGLVAHDSSGNGNDGILVNFPTDNSQWAPHDGPPTEAALVLARMTTPSQAFSNAVVNYVQAEQAAINDNWSLTSERVALDSDTEINALTPWKESSNVSGDLSSVFVPYEGVVGNGAYIGNVVSWDFQIGTELPDSTTLFNGVNLKNYNPNSSDRRATIAFSYNDNKTRFICGVNAIRNSISSASSGFVRDIESLGEIVWISKIPSGAFEDYWNGTLDQSIARSTLDPVLDSNAQIYMAHVGTHRGWIAGSNVGFDIVANAINQKNYNDAMLIEKHRTVVDTVLNRYTNLSSIETWAISRLVARSEENGQWSTRDEVFLLGLFDEANSLIGLKYNTGSNDSGSTHISGRGFIDGIINSNFIPSIDNVNSSLNNAASSTIGRVIDTSIVSTRFYASISAVARDYLLTSNTGISVFYYIQNTANLTSVKTWDNYINIGISRIAGDTVLLYYNGEEYSNQTQSTTGISTSVINLGHHSNMLINAWQYGSSVGFNHSLWNTDFHQAVNELEIEKANDNNDWNIQDKVYDWSSRELAPDQLEKLLNIILTNSDTTTTGRVINIVGNLGKTLVAQGYINNLVNVNGFTVTEV